MTKEPYVHVKRDLCHVKRDINTFRKTCVYYEASCRRGEVCGI